MCLNLGPLIGVLFRDDGRLGIGIVFDEIVFELEGYDVVRIPGDDGQEFGVGFIGKRIASGFDEGSGVEVAIGEIAVDVIVVVEDSAEHIDGSIDAFDVEIFGLLSGAFDGEELERADLRQDEDEASVEVAAETGCLAIGLPVVVGGCLVKFVDEVGSRSGLGASVGKLFLWRMVSARAMLGMKCRTTCGRRGWRFLCLPMMSVRLMP